MKAPVPTPAELEARQAAARLMAAARWAKTTRKERREFALQVAGRRTPETMGGRPRDPDRCPCGKFTAARAEARRHNCEAPPAQSTQVEAPSTQVDAHKWHRQQNAQRERAHRTKEKTAQ